MSEVEMPAFIKQSLQELISDENIKKRWERMIETEKFVTVLEYVSKEAEKCAETHNNDELKQIAQTSKAMCEKWRQARHEK